MTTRREFFVQTAAAAVVAATSAQMAHAAQAAASDVPAPTRRKPGIVQTVQGPIPASGLGFTLPHEHLFSSSAGIWQVWPELLGGRADFVAKAVDRLKAVRDRGVSTIVDLTTADLGRNIRIMEEVSRKSGMQIVPCTGHWLHPALSISSRTMEELADFFVREIDRGIEDTDIKAGVIKVATEEMTPVREKILRAAARASKATGVPIETHSMAAIRGGEQQAEIFESEGLDPAMVSIGHSDHSTDLDYLMGLVKRGYTISMDHFPLGVVPPGQTQTEAMAPSLWPAKAERVKKLVDAGFANKIFLSNDWLFADSAFPTGTAAMLDKINPDGMLFLTRKVIPKLKELGVSDQAIRTMTVDNPRRFFGGG